MAAPSQLVTRRGLLVLAGAASTAVVTGCGSEEAATPPSATGLRAMTVHKDVACGCCDGWVDHAREHGFTVTTDEATPLHEIWEQHDVPADLQSCHLARTADGHLFIGHVPAGFVTEFLADPPSGARGLSVPAMPVGTPGMEQGEQFDPYEVMLLTEGGAEVYAEVTSPSDQSV